MVAQVGILVKLKNLVVVEQADIDLLILQTQSPGGGSVESQKTLNPGTTYTLTVGSGGQDSTFSGSGYYRCQQVRGGKGAGPCDPSTVGGSGGGGNSQGRSPSAGTANEGYAGGSRGGGGAGQVGGSSGGGNGVSSTITGSSVARAGGGATAGGSGGSGGGGNGGQGNQTGQPGTANTGGGSGAGGLVPGQDRAPGTPGSGNYYKNAYKKFLRDNYRIPQEATDGSDKILTFTASGTLGG